MARRKLEVELIGDDAQLRRVLGRNRKDVKQWGSSVERSLARVEKFGTNAVLGLGTALGGLALGGLVKSVQAFQEQERVAAQTAAAIRSTGGAAKVTARDVDRLATAISRKSGIDDEAVAASENVLLTFTKVRNETGKGNKVFDRATQAVADMATRLNGGAIPSLEQLNSRTLQVGKALNDPIKGVSMLGRAGVQFTAQQKEQIKTLVESGNQLGAQRIVLKELETQFGGSAEAAGNTFSGSIEKARVSLGNLGEALGEKAAPGLKLLTDAFSRTTADIEGILNRSDLSFEEKFDLSTETVRKNFKPAIAEIKRQLDDAQIGDKLADVFEEAFPKILEAAGEGSGKAAIAFVKGWLRAGIWGKLFTVGFLAARMGAFSKVGGIAADRFMAKWRARTATGMATAVGAEGAVGGAVASKGKWGKLGSKAGLAFKGALIAAVTIGLFEALKGPFNQAIEDLGLGINADDPTNGEGQRRADERTTRRNRDRQTRIVNDRVQYRMRRGGRWTRWSDTPPRGWRAGGLVPAAVSSGELLVGPDGSASVVPGARVAADNVLTALRPGTMVFTDDGQRRLAMGEHPASVLASQAPHFRGGGIAGAYTATAYGPPWNRMNGTGVTRGGTDLRDGKRAHIVAVDPSVIPLGTRLTANPNPFGNPRLVFKADDTGGAIRGRRIDFYDWRGRASQREWGRRRTRVSRASGSGGDIPGTPGGLAPDLRPLSRREIDRRRLTSPLLEGAFSQGMDIGREGGRRIDPLVGEIVDAMRIPLRRNPSARESGGSAASGGVGRGFLSRAKAKVIGTPYAGTHNLGNWQSDNALDLAFPFGTILHAINSGKVTKTGGSGSFGGRFGGRNFTLKGPNRSWFYAHMKSLNVRAGQTVRAGQIVGRSGKANGVDHLHIGVSSGNPRSPLGYRRGGRVGLARFQRGGVTGRALGLGRLGSGDNSGANRGLKALVDAISDAEGVSFGRLDRLADTIKDQIRSHFKGGLTSRERVQVERLRGALTAVTAEMGRRTGELVGQAEHMLAAIDSTRNTFEQQARIAGTDLDSLEGVGQAIAQRLGEGDDLAKVRRKLVAARARAKRAGDKDAVKEIQEQLDELDSAVRDRIGDIAEMTRSAADQAAAKFREGLEKGIDDKLTADLAAIDNSPEAQELRALQAGEVADQRSRQDKAQQKALTDAQAKLDRAKRSGSARLIADAQAEVDAAQQEISDTARDRRIEELQANIDAAKESAQGEADVAKEGLDQQEADYQKTLDTQLDALIQSLADRKITYQDFANAVNGILGPLGVEFPNAAATPAPEGRGVSWAVWNRWSPEQRERYRDRHRNEWDEYRPRMHGGRVQRGMPYLVGEAGPEPFIPDQSGTIVSNADWQRMTKGGDGPTIIQHFNGVDRETAERIAQMAANRVLFQMGA